MAIIMDGLPAGKTSDREIRAFEAVLGHRLPPEYRRFLLKFNGGHPQPDAFLLGMEEDVVMCFFPMRPMELREVDTNSLDELRIWPLHCAWKDLQDDMDESENDDVDRSLLPIGTDGSGNYICIALERDNRGAVLFLDHETMEGSPLANGFVEFLRTLRPRQRTDCAW
jgi:hypothetical protein